MYDFFFRTDMAFSGFVNHSSSFRHLFTSLKKRHLVAAMNVISRLLIVFSGFKGRTLRSGWVLIQMMENLSASKTKRYHFLE